MIPLPDNLARSFNFSYTSERPKLTTIISMPSPILIFHGTEGYPKENWFPWLKQKLEKMGHTVKVPQFPSPPDVPAKIAEWFKVLEKYEQYLNENTIIIGHSLGGVLALRLLEKISHPIRTAVFVGTPIGIKPILNYDRDNSFSGFEFNWKTFPETAKIFSYSTPTTTLLSRSQTANNWPKTLTQI